MEEGLNDGSKRFLSYCPRCHLLQIEGINNMGPSAYIIASYIILRPCCAIPSRRPEDTGTLTSTFDGYPYCRSPVIEQVSL